jgi:hypothetical protein
MTYVVSTMEPGDRSLSNIGQVEGQTIARDSAAVVREIDSLADSRWDELVAHHPDASIFHTRAASVFGN